MLCIYFIQVLHEVKNHVNQLLKEDFQNIEKDRYKISVQRTITSYVEKKSIGIRKTLFQP